LDGRSQQRAGQIACLVMALLLIPGCYAAHTAGDSDPDADVVSDADVIADASFDATDGHDAAFPCPGPGTYDAAYRLESTTPEGCAQAGPDTFPITFPLEEHFVGDPDFSSLTVTPVGACQWAFDFVETSPFPGNRFRVWGVMGIGPNGVFGRLESSDVRDAGPGCDTVAILGGGVPGSSLGR
jgi:hypothetical protein